MYIHVLCMISLSYYSHESSVYLYVHVSFLSKITKLKYTCTCTCTQLLYLSTCQSVLLPRS